MGLFKSAREPGYIGTFSSPHSPQDTLRVVYAGLASQLSAEDYRVTQPGPLADIRISRLDPDGLTVTAGNSVETYFAFHVDLTPAGSGCTGLVRYDRPEGRIRRWMGNAIKINAGVRMALDSASVRVSDWRMG